jgi:arogenate dehydrogenase (NADP+)
MSAFKFLCECPHLHKNQISFTELIGMNIGIIGLGLIGGSLALDLRHQHTIFGVSRRPETCEQAIARKVVDYASPNLALLAKADVIFLCTPLGAIESTVTQLLPHLSPQTILTDVGSVKGAVVRAIAPLWQNFVAGTAESGLDAALTGLFVGRPYVLTPTDSTPAEAVETVAELARSLQAQIYQCSPEAHDQAVAWISHLPVMVSASLIAACLSEPNPEVLKLAQSLASSGFRDTSRVGGGNPELGRMMAEYNREELVRSLHAYRHQLDQFITQIEQSDWDSIQQRLTQTQIARPHFLRESE